MMNGGTNSSGGGVPRTAAKSFMQALLENFGSSAAVPDVQIEAPKTPIAGAPQEGRPITSQSSYLDDSDDYMSPSTSSEKDEETQKTSVQQSVNKAAMVVGPKVAPSSTTLVHQKRIEEDEVVDDADDEVRRCQPLCATDVTFGSIPNSRNHFTVDSNAIAVVNNLKRQWKNHLERGESAESQQNSMKQKQPVIASLSHVVVGNKTTNGSKLQLPRSAVRGPVISLSSIVSTKSNKSTAVKKIRLKTSNNSSRQSSITILSEKSEITKNATNSQKLKLETKGAKQPRFNKGIISIKYKRSPIRLVSPPILKKVTGDSNTNNITDDSTSVAANKAPPPYFKQPGSKSQVNSAAGSRQLNMKQRPQTSTCLMTVTQLNNRRRLQESSSMEPPCALQDTTDIANKVSKTFTSGRQDSITSLRTTMLKQTSSVNLVAHAENLVYSDQFSEHSAASPNFSLPPKSLKNFAAHRKQNSFNSPHLLSKELLANKAKQKSSEAATGLKFNCRLAAAQQSKYASNQTSPTRPLATSSSNTNVEQPYENNYLSGQQKSFLKRITVNGASSHLLAAKKPSAIQFASPRVRVKQAPPLKQKNNLP